jgi:RNA polymerase sigma-70 factor (ECF subfamily)
VSAAISFSTASLASFESAPILALAVTPLERPSFESLYDDYARFVFRALIRLGVSSSDIEDVVQEVFLVIHRRLDDFREESSARTWVYGIAVHVARNYRRSGFRRRDVRGEEGSGEQAERLPEAAEHEPDALLERSEAAELLIQLLQELDQDSREVFVLAELEEMTAVEIGEVLHLNPNTVSSRLRLARRSFEQAVKRSRARDQWRMR